MNLLLETVSKNKKAWEKWKGFPNRKTESFRYISLKKLEENQTLEFGPVHFEYENISKLIILPLKEAKQTYAPLLEKRTLLLLKKEKDPFFFLNQAVGTDGLFIYVPPNVRLKDPLIITQHIQKNHAVHPRIEIFLGKGAHLTTILSIKGKNFWNNANLNVTLDEGAHYTHYDQAGQHQDSWDFLSCQGELKENATMNFFSFGQGAKVQRRDLAIALTGKYSEATLKGLSLLDHRLEAHVHIRIDHIAPNTCSSQLFKHVLADQARSSFEGKIFVEQEAQQTKAYQLNRNLILSEKAAAFSKPNLEIFADDVKASHGATVSRPNLEQLFYLRSRGLSQKIARNHLVRGFCRELLQDISIRALYNQFSKEINDYLSS